MIVDRVPALNDFPPNREFSGFHFWCFYRDKDVECEGGPSELAFVEAMTAKIECGLRIPGDDIGTAETGRLRHG